MISVPKGRKDLTEGIQIVEKIIGPVEYLDETKKNSYSSARNRKGGKHRPFNTVDLRLDSAVLQQTGNISDNSDIMDENEMKLNSTMKSLYTSMTQTRKRGASLLSESKTARKSVNSKAKTPKVKLAIVCILSYIFLYHI